MNNSIQFNDKLDADFKFEVVISSLIEQGHNQELIQIFRDGISRRSISKDIENVYHKYNDKDLIEYLHIHVNREGLYDILPEGLFHRQIYKQGYKDIQADVEKSLNEIKIHREPEFFARPSFFVLPP